ncbi:MAG: co-chaperone DjlA [Gammaproteobacteria bacterium]|nr:co-chaperone DjlA [Gammaproteobacteria bacterium]
MSWWGKIIGGGFGFMLGGPLGALLGATFGHQFDRGISGLDLDVGDTQRTQAAFFTTSFSVMGYLAKADGQVTRDEIQMAENIMAQMNLSAEQRAAAIDLFNQGKQDDFPLADVLQQFKRECHRRRNLIQMFLEILIATAFADGKLHPEEHKALNHVSNSLGFSSAQLEQLIQMVMAQQQYAGAQQGTHKTSLKDAYTVLGVSSTATDAEVKKAYRRLMSQHHPDKLVAKGLPEEMLKLATEKTQEIKAAYDQIKRERK